jgi:hypothetical protein
VDFSGARLHGVELLGVNSWRTAAVGASFDLADGRGIEIAISPRERDALQAKVRSWLDSIPAGSARSHADARFSKYLTADLSSEMEEDLATPWIDLGHRRWDIAQDDALANLLAKLGCEANPESVPYLARGILRQIIPIIVSTRNESDVPIGFKYFPNRPNVSRIATSLLAPDCEGAKGLTDGERAKLRQLAATGAAKAATPP